MTPGECAGSFVCGATRKRTGATHRRALIERCALAHRRVSVLQWIRTADPWREIRGSHCSENWTCA